MKLIKKITEVTLVPTESTLFDENSIIIRAVDEGGGLFFELSNINMEIPFKVELDELEQIILICKEMSQNEMG